ncbi:MAG: sulfurtransferase TusA family protein [Candidatus Omnitrophica bacterium]|nr:sulfurtransferase TusA family protein [Candidatus Omnitrophota bacterium]
MIKGYELPLGLDAEIDSLEELIRKHRLGEVSATELKAHRVPFGVYEQRQTDTYMVRIRCAGGFITPVQLEGVSAIALRYGIGDVHVTSRQELQIHYVKLDDIIAIMRRLKEIGLSTRGGGGNTVRNIACAVDAGIDPQEIFDVSVYVSALTTRLIAESDSWNLPRKFKIAFSGSAEDEGYATISDVGFIAKIKDGRKGFRVYAAGGLGAKSAEGKLLLDFIDAEEVYPVTKALKNVFFKYGNRRNKHAARLRSLWQNLGEEEFRKRFSEEYAIINAQGVTPLLIEDQVQVVAPTAGGQKISFDQEDFLVWKTRFVKPQKQEGLYSVLIPIELGFISCDSVAGLARFLKPFGSDVLRMTKDQNFLVRNIPSDYLFDLFIFLKNTISQLNQPALYARILSCTGASTCQLGICFSRQAARALMDELKNSNLNLDKIGDIKINFSGCPNSCGHHPVADLGFSGKALRNLDGLYPAYSVFAGAIINDGQTKLAEYIGEIPAKALILLVKDFLSAFISKAESFTNFREYIRESGKVDLKEIILRYSKVPGFGEDKKYYFDWGADTIFSLAERKAGECSAGFFDLLEMDLNNIRNTQAALAKDTLDVGQKEKLLGELVFYASRALLITRGLDAKNHKESYEGFLSHFIGTGLVDESFRDIITDAQRGDTDKILAKQAQVLELAKAVQALYETMDNSFNFKKPVVMPEASKKEVAITIVKDFRGVTCPLNFVKTKIELAKLKTGDLLEIWLDDGAPIENVPGSVKAEGHKVLGQKRIDNYWAVTIEKK